MGSGGKTSSQPTTQTVNQNTIPEWMRPYATQLLGQGQALTDLSQNPYQPYGGQQIAGFNPLQQQAFQNIAGMTPANQFNQATGLAGLAGMQDFTQAMNLARNAGAQDFTGKNVSKYMSPYMKEVVKQQQLGAIEDYSNTLPQLASATTQVGGLGGTRQALLQSQAQRGLQDRLSDIRAQGQQAAFGNAQQQFNQSLQNQLASAGQLGQLGMMNAQNQLASAGQLGQLGMMSGQQARDIAQTQLGAGQQIQGVEQRGLDALLQQFNAQQQYPYQQLGFMSNLIRGLPTMQQGQAMYQQPGSPLGQVANLGLGLGSLMGGGG